MVQICCRWRSIFPELVKRYREESKKLQNQLDAVGSDGSQTLRRYSFTNPNR